MRVLSTVPAFGWETKNCNANNYNKPEVDKALAEFDAKYSDKLTNGSEWEIKMLRLERNSIANILTKGHIQRNFNKCVSYIPGPSIFLGAIHLMSACRSPKDKLTNKNKHIGRAVAEICCVSFMLVGVDLVVTLKRTEKKKKLEMQ